MSRSAKRNGNPKAVTEVDALIGARIRRYRTEAGISQSELGAASGVTFQQVQKYEKGASRVSVSRLSEFAATLGVPLTAFFDDFPQPGSQARRSPGIPLADRLLASEQGLALVRGFLALRGGVVRAKVVALVTALAESETGAESVH